MTFTEAALEVLQREGRAMHAREIADLAVAWGLLSHVGKTPVQTMSARISAIVAKGSDKSPFVRVRPGVFALARWGGKTPGPAPAASAARPGAEPEAVPKKRKRRRRKKTTAKAADKPQGKPQRSSVEKPEPRRSSIEKPKPGPKAAAQPRQAEDEPAPKQRKSRRGSKRAAADNGRDITLRADEVLRSHTGSVPLDKLAATLGWSGDRGALLLEALLAADGLDRELKGLRPRFVHHRGGWALAERGVSGEIVELERQISEAADRLSRLAQRQVLRKLKTIPLGSLVRVVTVLLRRLGFDAMSPVDRGSKDEFHLSVLDRRGGGRFRTAVVIRRDASTPIGDRAVTELRGTLHHYDSMSAMIVTTGSVSEQARAEAVVANLPPVALVDGETLARELVREGIGVRARRIGLPAFDEAFFAALGE